VPKAHSYWVGWCGCGVGGGLL